MKDQIQLVAAQNHPLAKKAETISIHELEKETFILRPSGSNTREVVENLFEKEHFTPKNMKEFATNEAVKLAIAKGYGIGFSVAQCLQARNGYWYSLSCSIAGGVQQGVLDYT